MYLHKTKNGHYTPPCCYFSGELEVVECLPQTFSGGMIPSFFRRSRGSEGWMIVHVATRMSFHQLDISEGKNDNGKEQLMDQELFNPQSSSVSSSRIIYTPSTFARTSLLHLQEVGSLQAVHPHISQREDPITSGISPREYRKQWRTQGRTPCVFLKSI